MKIEMGKESSLQYSIQEIEKPVAFSHSLKAQCKMTWISVGVVKPL